MIIAKNPYELVIILVMCHMLGDYVLQIDYIVKTKKENFYHLFVHCMLYCVPFMFVDGIRSWFPFLFLTHILIDWWKCKMEPTIWFNEKEIYIMDQVLHYCVLAFILSAYYKF